MIALAIFLLVGMFVLIWTGFRGDGSGGYNPIALIGNSLNRRKVRTA